MNWGNQRVPFNTGDPLQALALGVAPFGYNDGINGNNPRKSKILDLTDGTSNTLLMSEIIMAKGDGEFDIRGDFLNDDRPCTQFMTIQLPNTTVKDVSPYCNDVTFPGNPPCTNVASGTAFKSARSRHTGGVNVLLGDGSVRFIRDSIAIVTWRALGTMNGGEVLADY